MSVAVLRTGIDTLEASFAGKLHEGFADLLESAKQCAQQREIPTHLRLGPLVLMVQPAGMKPWRWLLKASELHVRVGQSSSRHVPAASIRLGPVGFAQRTPSDLYGLGLAVLSELGVFGPKRASRIDIAADFQGWEPSVAEMQAVTCPATWRPIMPSIDKPETYQFGRGQIVVRLYDKTAEIARTDKEWLRELWAASPAYDTRQAVWRAEVQLRGGALKELGIGSVKEALESAGGLFDYGLRWCQLRVPTADAKKTRWPEDERWQQLRSAEFDGEPLLRTRPEPQLIGLDKAISRHLGLAASVAARTGLDDYDDTAELLANEARRALAERGADFADLVFEKRCRLV